MGIFYTIVAILAGWYVLKLIVQESPAKRIEKLEEFAETMISSNRTVRKVAYGEESDPTELRRMKDWYIRLKEKYKHDVTKQVQLAEDWMNYAYNVSSKSTNFYLSLDAQEEDADSEEREEKAREAHLKIEEIENRFASLLGSGYEEELKLDREKKKKAAEAFWNSEAPLMSSND